MYRLRKLAPFKQFLLTAIVGSLYFLAACEPKNNTPMVLPPVPGTGLGIANDASDDDGRPRMALVIGNGSYRKDELKNPVNDANAIASSLRDLGFEVTLAKNLGASEMDAVIKEFSKRLPEGAIAVFYYAGHGVQVDGENYLIPTDAELEKQQEVQWETIALSKVLISLEAADTTFNLLIIDACRDNPFYRKWRSASRGGAQKKGLAAQPPPDGTAIAFSTGSDDFAEDGQGDYSPYTASLLNNIGNKGEDVAFMMRKVREEVKVATNSEQIPWFQESFSGKFSFNPLADEVEIAAGQSIPPLTDSSPVPVRRAPPDVSATQTQPPPQPEVLSQRISFPAGQDGISLANDVEPGLMRQYLVNVREGQILSVRIVNSQGGLVEFDVLRPGGEILADASGVVYWEGLLQVGGDYAINMRGDQAAEFTLEIQATSQLPSGAAQ